MFKNQYISHGHEKSKRKWICSIAGFFLVLASSTALAHHGGVSAAFGPGAPVETSSPLTLPKGKFLLFERVEVSPFKTFGDSRDDGGNDKFTFTNTMFGYGIRDYLSAYISIPYAKKEILDDTTIPGDQSATSWGYGDINVILQYGFKYGAREGFKGWYSFGKDDVNGKEYTLPQWKFGLSASTTIPSGKIHNTDNSGNVLGLGSQTGFAVPSYNFTGIVSKMLVAHWTWSADVQFRTFALSGAPGAGKPGNEFRLNNAIMYEILENKGAPLSRVDLIAEANFLSLRRDLDENRVPVDSSGGEILYLSPGARLTFYDRASLGLLYKFVGAKDLNDQSQQQGGEGLEDYRFIATFSFTL